jgi:hypothetical protein
MSTMVMTAELLEPVPRSIILASLTNNLPSGVSLLDFQLKEKETQTLKPSAQQKTSSKYAAANSKADSQESKQMVETNIQIKGIAPSDIQVADFIARLDRAILFDNVSLVESKETEIEKIKYRQFHLKALIRSDLTLTKEDIDAIREKREQST